MILVDIGNTTACVYNNGSIKRIEIANFNPGESKYKIYYISVNSNFTSLPANFINLEPYFKIQTNYIGLGIDRLASCYCIENGIVVDAGSAITVDKMKDGKHQGGFILPGINAYKNAYANISCRLDYTLNTSVDLELIPNSTQNAISYGVISSIINSILHFAQDEVIYITGGDAGFLNKYFKNAIHEKNLVFQGMIKLINELKI